MRSAGVVENVIRFPLEIVFRIVAVSSLSDYPQRFKVNYATSLQSFYIDSWLPSPIHPCRSLLVLFKIFYANLCARFLPTCTWNEGRKSFTGDHGNATNERVGGGQGDDVSNVAFVRTVSKPVRFGVLGDSALADSPAWKIIARRSVPADESALTESVTSSWTILLHAHSTYTPRNNELQ